MYDSSKIPLNNNNFIDKYLSINMEFLMYKYEGLFSGWLSLCTTAILVVFWLSKDFSQFSKPEKDDCFAVEKLFSLLRTK